MGCSGSCGSKGNNSSGAMRYFEEKEKNKSKWWVWLALLLVLMLLVFSALH